MSITNRWDEEKHIGKGAFAEVYKVKQNGNYYALKKIFKSICLNPNHRQVIIREIDIMKVLDHPNIIKLHKAVIEDD